MRSLLSKIVSATGAGYRRLGQAAGSLVELAGLGAIAAGVYILAGVGWALVVAGLEAVLYAVALGDAGER